MYRSRNPGQSPAGELLHDCVQAQMKTLSVHTEMAKAFAYMLKQWHALCPVAVGRKNYLFFGPDNGGESAAMLGTCKLNGVETESWLCQIISKIGD